MKTLFTILFVLSLFLAKSQDTLPVPVLDTVQYEGSGICHGQELITLKLKTYESEYANCTFAWLYNYDNSDNWDTIAKTDAYEHSFHHPESFATPKLVYYSLAVLSDNSAIVGAMSDTAVVVQINPSPPTAAKFDYFTGCFGENNGGISISNIVGIDSQYKVSIWNDDIFYNDNAIISDDTANFENLKFATYNISIENYSDMSCSFDTVISMIEPSPIVISFNKTNPLCSYSLDGTIEFDATGGTEEFLYSLDDKVFTAINIFENLPKAKYQAFAMDGNSCLDSAEIIINEPLEILPIMDFELATCVGDSDGKIIFTAENGTSLDNKYSFVFENNGNTIDYADDTDIFTVEDINSDIYELIVTDINNCQKDTSFLFPEPAILFSRLEIFQPKCNGESGDIIVEATGGHSADGNYIYKIYKEDDLISTIENDTAVFNNFLPAVYKIEVIDDNICLKDTTITIEEKAKMTVSSFLSEEPLCYTSNDGQLKISVKGGVTDEDNKYLYKLYKEDLLIHTESIDTLNMNDLESAVYKIEILDKNLCFIDTTVFLSSPDSFLVDFTKTNTSCLNANDGSLQVLLVGGIAPYDYQIFDNNDQLISNTNEATNLVSGKYKVQIEDALGCKNDFNTDTVVVLSPESELQISVAEKQDILCNGLDNGKITLSALGGWGAYKYSKDGVNFSASPKFLNLISNDYTFYLKDNKNCVVTIDTAIIEPDEISANLSDTNSVSCYLDEDGAFTINAVGGTAPYYFIINNDETNKQTNNVFTNMKAGKYQIEIQDINECKFNFSHNISQPEELEAESLTSISTLCHTSLGAVTISATGGTEPYSFVWNDEDGNLLSSTNETAIDLLAGIYHCTITDDNSCQTTINTAISNNDEVVIEVASTDTASCSNSKDGKAELVFLQTINNPTIEWWKSDEKEKLNISELSVDTLLGGDYFVEITDENDCKYIVNFEVPSPSAIKIDFNILNEVDCNGSSSATVETVVTGGTEPYQYLWTDIAENNTSPNIQNIAQGIYNLQVTDANSCIKNNALKIEEPDEFVFDEIFVSVPNCYGDFSNKITVRASGGTNIANVFTYQLLKGENLIEEKTAKYSVFDNLQADDYNIKIIDDNNCEIINTVTVADLTKIAINNFQLNEPVCFGGKGDLQVATNGGTTENNYNYILKHNDTEVSSRFKKVFQYNSLLSGDYNLKIKDENNCEIDTSFVVNEPEALELEIIKEDISCKNLSNAKAEAIVTGGEAPYVYNWTDIYGVSFSTDSIAENLGTGLIYCEVKDANLCPFGAPLGNYMGLKKSVNIVEPEKELKLEIDFFQNVSSNGNSDGQINAKATGGWGNYQYAIENDNYIASGLFDNLTAGTYTITVNDNDCNVSIEQIITEPEIFVATVSSITDNDCFGESKGEIIISAKGGVKPYRFSIDGANYQQDSIFSNLPKGDFSIEAIDNISDTIVLTASIEEETEIIASTTAKTDATCGEANASVSISAVGGKQPYSFLWNDENNQTEATANNLKAGIYKLSITDANSCIKTEQIGISNTDGPAIEIVEIIPSNCSYSTDGSATINITEGLQPYSILWNDENAQTTLKAENLKGDDYLVEVTDSNDCIAVKNIIVPAPDELQINFADIKHIDCYSDCDGELKSIITGGTTPYSYNWNSDSSILQNICAGKYILNIKDANNCLITDSIDITQGAEIKINLNDTTICPKTKLLLDAENEGLFFEWTSDIDFTSNEQIVEIEKAGEYYLTIKDEKNCELSDTMKLNISSTVLDANFLITSNAEIGDTVVIIEISQPTPDNLIWTLPEEFEIVEPTDKADYRYAVAKENGTYTISLDAELGECSDTEEKEIIISIPNKGYTLKDTLNYDYSGIEKYEIYPNPVSTEKLTVDVELTDEQKITIDIINSQGKRVYQRQSQNIQEKHKLNINISNFASGIYLMRLNVNDEIVSKRFVKL